MEEKRNKKWNPSSFFNKNGNSKITDLKNLKIFLIVISLFLIIFMIGLVSAIIIPNTSSFSSCDSPCTLVSSNDCECPVTTSTNINIVSCYPPYKNIGNTCVECQQDKDCGKGYFCNLDDSVGSVNSCTHYQGDPGTCKSNQDCPTGTICEQRSCVAGCVKVNDCLLTTFQGIPITNGLKKCISGNCVTIACTNEASCADQTGKKCNTNSGLCVTCLTNNDCISPLKCNSAGSCVACLTSSDCPLSSSGQYKCLNQKCVQCLSNNDCASGKVCLKNSCYDINTKCFNNNDCSDGMMCLLNSNANTGGTCVGTVCSKDADCAIGKTCSGGKCMSNTCSSNSQCSNGQICSSGVCAVCTPQCSGKNCGDDGCGGKCGSCADGQICTNGNCISVNPTPTSIPSSGCNTNCDGKVSRTELGIAINNWMSGKISRAELGNEINAWVKG